MTEKKEQTKIPRILWRNLEKGLQKTHYSTVGFTQLDEAGAKGKIYLGTELVRYSIPGMDDFYATTMCPHPEDDERIRALHSEIDKLRGEYPDAKYWRVLYHDEIPAPSIRGRAIEAIVSLFKDTIK